MAEALRVLGAKLSAGVVSSREYDAILAAHIASSRPAGFAGWDRPLHAHLVGGDGGGADEAGPAVEPEPEPIEVRVCVATFNLGNAPIDPSTLPLWIDASGRFDIVVVALQESWLPLGTLPTLGARSPPAPGSSPPGAAAGGGGERVAFGTLMAAASPTQVILRHLGPRYTRLVETSRGEMRLAIFTLATPRQPVHSVEVSAENTGALGIAPNKGGLLARLVHGVTSLCFVGCHLEAHEGTRHFASRKRSCEDILAGARVCDRALDATFQHHHTILMGDLNFRVDLALPMDYTDSGPAHEYDLVDGAAAGAPAWAEDDDANDDDADADADDAKAKGDAGAAAPAAAATFAAAGAAAATAIRQGASVCAVPPVPVGSGWGKTGGRMDTGARELATQAKFELACTLLELGASGRQRLLAHDELLQALSKREVLGRFATVAPRFAPTFKRVKGVVEGFNAKRIPSWCDRVLWCSMPGAASDLTLLEYSSAELVTSSDHKPVYATFQMRTAPALRPPDASREVSVVAHVSSLEAVGLPVMDGVLQGGKADPYVEARLHPPEAAEAGIAGSVVCRSAVVPKNLNPSWPEPLVIPLGTCPSSVAAVHVVLTVLDRDVGLGDDTIGTACVPLARAAAAAAGNPEARARFAFDEPLLLNGVARGTIRGVVELVVSEAVD